MEGEFIRKSFLTGRLGSRQWKVKYHAQAYSQNWSYKKEGESIVGFDCQSWSLPGLLKQIDTRYFLISKIIK